MFYWHITDKANVRSFLANGLRSPVYLCNNLGACLRIREQQLEEGSKAGIATLLKVWLSDKFVLSVDEDTDYDAFICSQDILANRITIEMDGI
jgi:hypothetical protein